MYIYNILLYYIYIYINDLNCSCEHQQQMAPKVVSYAQGCYTIACPAAANGRKHSQFLPMFNYARKKMHSQN